METIITPVELVMWEKVELPESKKNEVSGKYEKTGEKVEKTQYTFRDEFGTKLVLLGDNKYREFERRQCTVEIKIAYNDFERKTKVSLVNVRVTN